MAVKLSRQPGCFSLLLNQQTWLDVQKLASPLARELGVTRSDAVRALRQQRGILLEGLSNAQAQSALNLLAHESVGARIVADSDVPTLPKPLEVSLARMDAACLETPSLVGAGLPQIWHWEHLAVVFAGILLDSKTQAANLTSGLDKGLLNEADVRKAQAQRHLELAKERVFPLSSEISRAEPELADALATAQRAKKAAKQASPAPEMHDFGAVQTVVDLIFTQPFERLRLTSKTRVQDLPRSAHPVKALHMLTAALVPLAGQALVSEAAALLAAGADSGKYLFEDSLQFEDYCRYGYFLRVCTQTPGV
jgi:hypothetical protein